jgi:hypothetical protein
LTNQPGSSSAGTAPIAQSLGAPYTYSGIEKETIMTSSSKRRQSRLDMDPQLRHTIAVRAGLARAAALTPEQRTEISRKAGLCSSATRTPEERSALARSGAIAANLKRWGARKPPAAVLEEVGGKIASALKKRNG